MRLRGETTTFQTRLEISEYAAAGWDDPKIATAVGCSVWTVRKWRQWEYTRLSLLPGSTCANVLSQDARHRILSRRKRGIRSPFAGSS